jgi:hypothetical protein
LTELSSKLEAAAASAGDQAKVHSLAKAVSELAGA